VILTAPERERLRREIDRRKRERVGAKLSLDDAWLSIPEASSLVGIQATVLRLLIRDLGIERKMKSGATLIPVASLDRLREFALSSPGRGQRRGAYSPRRD
jgi:hypothetical protein